MKKRNLFMAATILCALFTVAFTFNAEHVKWMWADHKTVAVILAIAALFFASRWAKHQKMMGRTTPH